MAGRPASPVLVQGPAYVWIEDYEGLPEALHHTLPLRIVKTLVEGRLVLEGRRLAGFLYGKGGEDMPVLNDIEVPTLGHAVLSTLAVVATGRLRGIPCEIGQFETITRASRWACSFGCESLEFFISNLRFPQPKSTQAGVINFTSAANLRNLRHRLYEERKVVDKAWHST